MKTVNEVKGYIFSNGSSGKKWKRGRIQFSEGKKWIDNNKYVRCIIKTNLDTGEMCVASLNEHKKFLTEESYKEYMLGQFEKICLGY